MAAFFCVGFWRGFCFVLNFVWLKRLNNCDSACVPDINNAESLSTKFNGREDPRLSSLNLKILSFSLNCLTKWPTPAKPLPRCVGWMATQILSRREVQRVMFGKNFGWKLQEHQPDLKRVALKSKGMRVPHRFGRVLECTSLPGYACFWRGSYFRIHWVFLNVSLYKSIDGESRWNSLWGILFLTCYKGLIVIS